MSAHAVSLSAINTGGAFRSNILFAETQVSDQHVWTR